MTTAGEAAGGERDDERRTEPPRLRDLPAFVAFILMVGRGLLALLAWLAAFSD